MNHSRHNYAYTGRYDRPIRSRFAPESARAIGPGRECVRALQANQTTWPQFWKIVQAELRQSKYGTSTLKVYRQVLRSLDRTGLRPAAVTKQDAERHIDTLVDNHCSWAWISVSISVLRTVFDKLGGRSVTEGMVTPKRPRHLPTILSRDEVKKTITCAPTIRDRLLLGLMYGCGLKVSEACRLQWGDINPKERTIRVRYGRDTKERVLRMPEQLHPVLETGVARCAANDYIFHGKREGNHLSTRMAEFIFKKAFKAGGTPKQASCMTMRHSGAVHSLQDGATIRDVQEWLGHEQVATTMIYRHCILPKGVVSPADRLPQSVVANLHGAGKTTSSSHEAVKSAERIEEESVAHSHSLSMTQVLDSPLSTDGSEFPFSAEDSKRNVVAEFYSILKTHLWGRFLGQRRAQNDSG